jgi:hypothetical protein
MKRWVTSKKAEMDQEDIDRELFELAREWMAVSKLRKLPGHVAKKSDAALWKKFRQHPRRSSIVKNAQNSTKLPVDTAQCDQNMGWGHFTREVFKLGMDPITCKNHLLGDCLYFTYPYGWLTICFCLQVSQLQIICM